MLPIVTYEYLSFAFSLAWLMPRTRSVPGLTLKCHVSYITDLLFLGTITIPFYSIRIRETYRPTTFTRESGCPIYGKIRFLLIFIACFTLRTIFFIYGRIYGFVLTRFGYSTPLPPPPLHFRDCGILRKKKIFGRIYGFFRTEVGYYPPCKYTRNKRFEVGLG